MRAAILASFVVLAAASTAGGQIPQKFENLQYFPKDIPRDTLLRYMQGFTRALGVRCGFCHAPEEASPATTAANPAPGGGRERLNFKSDAKPEKRNARYMLRMADSINLKLLAALPKRSDPPVRVSCVTCHRGLEKPATLESALAETIEKRGVDSAVAQYRALRQNDMVAGMYDFRESSLQELARTLAERGKSDDALTLLQLDQEFYPQSAGIDISMAQLYEQRGDRDKAIARYRTALEKQPNNPMARRRLQQLTGSGGSM
ncbi:MAG TPA: c-type cytochrome [Gemmatimonadaceae bacterium]|nr:c-type cytochrome [Gemmatimonadaceae bacterium]